MLTNIETARLLAARKTAKAKGKTAHVQAHERHIARLPAESDDARIARWEDVQKAIHRLSSHIERHGVHPDDRQRFDRFYAYLQGAAEIAGVGGSRRNDARTVPNRNRVVRTGPKRRGRPIRR